MSHLYFDNWFSSLELLATFYKKEIYALGTIQQNRVKACRLLDDKSLKKCRRGAYKEKCGTVNGVGVTIVKWFDTKCITLVSRYAGGEPYRTVRRWVRKEKKYIDVPCPNIVREYSNFMGSVDLLDGPVAY